MSFLALSLPSPAASSTDLKAPPQPRVQIDEKQRIAVVRKRMESAIKKHKVVEARVKWDPNLHVVYLKMGMIPDEHEFSYLISRYGLDGMNALKALQAGNQDANHLAILKKILGKEEGRFDVSDEDVLKSKDFLLSLLGKQSSYLKDRFFPSFLAFLKNPSANGGDLGSMRLRLSEETQVRWDQAIQSGTPFAPYHKFEHLMPFMTMDQRKELVALLD